MTALQHRPWVPGACEDHGQRLARAASNGRTADVADRIEALAARNRTIHERECFNLNPATNVMNPRAEAILSAGLGSRPFDAAHQCGVIAGRAWPNPLAEGADLMTMST